LRIIKSSVERNKMNLKKYPVYLFIKGKVINKNLVKKGVSKRVGYVIMGEMEDNMWGDCV
jgi:hypothetical protein